MDDRVVTNDDAPVEVDLSPDERFFLVQGLGQWGGPVSPTEELAVAIGFASVGDMNTQRERIARQLDQGSPLTELDWTRALLCSEIMFASDVFGAGVEWEIVTPLDDETSIVILRALQRKLVSHRASIGTRPPRS
jgi:hypothetical protein